MKKISFAIAALLTIFTAAAVEAVPVSITIGDGSSGPEYWYGGGSTLREDNEVEPSNTRNDAWDLEGFYLQGTTLYMVGTYDFINNHEFPSGDIFIDTNGSYYTAGSGMDTGNYGYEYVLDLDFGALTFSAIDLRESEHVQLNNIDGAYQSRNNNSNPWNYGSGGEALGGGQIGYTSYATNEAAANAGFVRPDDKLLFGGGAGYAHNVVSVDLSSILAPGTTFTSHFTMQCGNDNLMGRATVPEPGTLLLLGSGLLGLGLMRCRRDS